MRSGSHLLICQFSRTNDRLSKKKKEPMTVFPELIIPGFEISLSNFDRSSWSYFNYLNEFQARKDSKNRKYIG